MSFSPGHKSSVTGALSFPRSSLPFESHKVKTESVARERVLMGNREMRYFVIVYLTDCAWGHFSALFMKNVGLAKGLGKYPIMMKTV